MNDPPLVPLNPSPSTPGLGGLLLPILGWNPPPPPQPPAYLVFTSCCGFFPPSVVWVVIFVLQLENYP